MTQPTDWNALAERCEAAGGPTKALDREIALAVGWVRKSPSEARRKHPAWFHPDDCRDGHVVMDSLHGTDVWRDPLAYSASVDAALTLLPEGWFTKLAMEDRHSHSWRWELRGGFGVDCGARAATPALALLAACCRAWGQAASGEMV